MIRPNLIPWPADVCLVGAKCNEELIGGEPEHYPPAGRLVLVMCWSENHIAYRDCYGIWRNALHHQELPGVLGWCALSAREDWGGEAEGTMPNDQWPMTSAEGE